MLAPPPRAEAPTPSERARYVSTLDAFAAFRAQRQQLAERRRHAPPLLGEPPAPRIKGPWTPPSPTQGLPRGVRGLDVESLRRQR